MPVLIGEVPCVLADRQQQSKERIVTAYLAFTDDVPLIAGFEGLLDRWRLHMDYDSKEAYLEGEW